MPERERRVIVWSPNAHGHAALFRRSNSELVLVVNTETPDPAEEDGICHAGDKLVLDAHQLEALGIRLEMID